MNQVCRKMDTSMEFISATLRLPRLLYITEDTPLMTIWNTREEMTGWMLSTSPAAPLMALITTEITSDSKMPHRSDPVALPMMTVKVAYRPT